MLLLRLRKGELLYTQKRKFITHDNSHNFGAFSYIFSNTIVAFETCCNNFRRNTKSNSGHKEE